MRRPPKFRPLRARRRQLAACLLVAPVAAMALAVPMPASTAGTLSHHHGRPVFRPPVDAPVTDPFRPPVDAPVTDPFRPPVDAPVTDPFRPPVDAPVTDPFRPPVDAPVTDPFRPPVDAPVTDPFRPPENPYGPGNRGVEYDTEPGDVVRAAASGTVVFAGAVAGTLHVTVDHGGGVVSSYSYLQRISVRDGTYVEVSAVVGIAGERLHFGVRVDGSYTDPAGFIGVRRVRVRLVPLRSWRG